MSSLHGPPRKRKFRQIAGQSQLSFNASNEQKGKKKSHSDKLKEVCISSGLAIVDVPADGDCMLHAIADQLQVVHHRAEDATTLRKLAVDFLIRSPAFFSCNEYLLSEGQDLQTYLDKQSKQGEWCDELMLRAVCDALNVCDIHVHCERGNVCVISPSVAIADQHALQKPLKIGYCSEAAHYVSLHEAAVRGENETADVSDTPTTAGSDNGVASNSLEHHKLDSELTDLTKDTDRWDVSRFVGQSLTDDIKYSLLRNVHVPPATFTFPLSECGKQKRAFQRHWLTAYKGLTYSCKLDAAFCLPCVLFSTATESGVLVKKPFKDWKDGVRKLNAHFRGVQSDNTKGGTGFTLHAVCVERMCNFQKVMDKTAKSLQSHYMDVTRQHVERNRCVLKSIFETILLCGKQGLALRGHRETEEAKDKNRGNFYELLKFRISAGDNTLKFHFDTARKNATYTSKTVQNEGIDIVSSVILERIVNEVQRFYSVSADEVQDIANKEQLAVCIRFVDKECEVREKFIGFVDITGDTSGAHISEAILQTVSKAGLCLHSLRGQCYDGAGNMAGRIQGAGPRIERMYPKALTFWCASHQLNLVIVSAAKLPPVRNMMQTVDTVVRFFRYSSKREHCLSTVLQSDSDGNDIEQCRKTKLQQMCRTRWVERHVAFDVFLELYRFIVKALENIAGDGGYNASSAAEASTLLSAITQFEFIITLVITREVMSYLKPLTVQLQGRQVDVDKAFHSITLTLACLNDIRMDRDPGVGSNSSDASEDQCHISKSQVLYDEAVSLAETVNVSPSMPRLVGRQSHRSNTPGATAEEYYRRNVFFPFVDQLISEISDRFSADKRCALQPLALIPTQLPELPRILSPGEVVGMYSDDLPSSADLSAELHMWQRLWVNVSEKPDTVVTALKACNVELFPNVHTLLTIMATLPVTSCETERTFSQLRLLKTYTRNSLGEDRLTGLALMKMHREIVESLDIGELVDKFAANHRRRMQLENIFQD